MADIVNYLQQINNAADDIEQIAKALKVLPQIEPYADNMLDSIIIIRANINCIQDIPHIYDKTVDVQPVNQWISVKDRLPEAVEEDVNGKIAFSELVLVYLVYDNGFTFITVDKCNTDKKRWLHEIPGEGCKVTHWQPLPEPPKDGDTE